MKDVLAYIATIRASQSHDSLLVPMPACAAPASEKNAIETTFDKVCVQFISWFWIARSNLQGSYAGLEFKP